MEKGLKYRIGLDIGIASVGWSVIKHNEKDEPCQIIDLGVRTFDAAENPKDGSSLAVKRREARGGRRRLRRRAFRIIKMREFLTENLLDNNVINKEHNLDIYGLRSKSLDEQISNEELYYLLVHFTKHRGFKSNRKSGNGKDDGKVLTATKQNAEKLKLLGYRTFGEMVSKCPDFFELNKNGTKEYFVRNHGNYQNCFLRDDLQFEMNLILNAQMKFGNNKITQAFIEKVNEIFSKQRGFDEGPNEPSPYKANFNVGFCTFEKEEKRAPKGSFTFEYFNALQRINHISILAENNNKTFLSDDDKQTIVNELFNKHEISYAKIRKLLKLNDKIKFLNLDYGKKDKNKNILTTAEVEKETVCKFDKVKDYAKALKIEISKENNKLFDVIGIVLSMRKGDDRRKKVFSFNANVLKDVEKDNLFEEEKVDKELINALKEAHLTEEQINNLLTCETNKFGNLSLKAMNKIIPFLENGFTYDKSCEKADYNFNLLSCEKQNKIKWSEIDERGTNELQEITSPVVLRSVSQTIKVVNAIIRKYGQPCAVFVELAREMSMNKDERNLLDKKMKQRAADNEKFVNEIKEKGVTVPSGLDIIKWRLYNEQGGKCAYSGLSFDAVLGGVENIFNNNNAQIDHIIPYSKCFDDSLNNKVLVLSNENQKKGNRVPKEYMTDEQWNKFVNFVEATYQYNPNKKRKLLTETSNVSDLHELNERALNDTKQTSKFILNLLRNHLIFAESKLIKKPARAVNGSITSYLRKIWGINKIRFESDKHHAIDACVVACASDGTINKITRFDQYKNFEKAKERKCLKLIDDNYVNTVTGETISKDEYMNYFQNWEEEFNNKNGKINLITSPWEGFAKELEIRLSENVCNELNKQELSEINYENQDLENLKPVFVSRMPTRKMLGPIHDETIRSSKMFKENQTLLTRKRIQDLTLKPIYALDNNSKVILDENNNKVISGYEINGYPEFAKKSDLLLYNALLQQLVKFDGKAKEAFKEKFYKPVKCSDGTFVNGNEVRTVKIEEKASDFVCLDKDKNNMLEKNVNNKLEIDSANTFKNKVAAKSSMVRIDLFRKDKQNFIVPVYVSDVYKQILPNKAIRQNYSSEKWIEMTPDYEFQFSLYPNDLVYMEKFNDEFKGKYVESKSENSGKPHKISKGLFYYNSTGIATNTCIFYNHDRSVVFESVGMRNIDVIHKYTVDVLGDYSKVKQERRQPLQFKRKK